MIHTLGRHWQLLIEIPTNSTSILGRCMITGNEFETIILERLTPSCLIYFFSVVHLHTQTRIGTGIRAIVRIKFLWVRGSYHFATSKSLQRQLWAVWNHLNACTLSHWADGDLMLLPSNLMSTLRYFQNGEIDQNYMSKLLATKATNITRSNDFRTVNGPIHQSRLILQKTSHLIRCYRHTTRHLSKRWMHITFCRLPCEVVP